MNIKINEISPLAILMNIKINKLRRLTPASLAYIIIKKWQKSRLLRW
jgi:hypothetical protein